MIHAIHIFTHLENDALSETFLDFLVSYDRKELFLTVILPQESPFLRQVEQTGHPPILLKNIGGAPHAFWGRHTLRKEIRKLSPGIIHVYDAWMLDALQKSGIPIVATLSGLETPRHKKGPHTVAALSPWAKERYLERGISEENLVLLPMGICPCEPPDEEECARLRRSLGFDPEDIVVGVFHPLVKCKGYPLLLAAAALAKEEIPNLRFLIWGNGPMRHQYMRKAVSLGLKKVIRFVSSEHDPIAFQGMMDIGMEISENAPLRRHTLTAMSLAKPMIAFHSGGNSYMVENGVSGLLIKQFSSKKIAGALLELARHPQIMLSMGSAGKKRMLRLFSAEGTAKETVSLYQQILTPDIPLPEGGDPTHEKSE